MADTAIAITQGSGTNIDTRTESTNGNHRQVVVLGDPTNNNGVAPVDGTNGLSVNLTNASVAVTAASLPLPTGAATSANQSTGNTSLASIDSKITAVNTGAVVVSSSALPSGAATAANQSTANTSLASIDTKATYLPGFAIAPYDYISYTSGSTTDTYVYKSGGSGGTTVATITVTYTDSTKGTLSTVAKT